MSLRAGSVCFRCRLRTATIGQSSGWVSPSLTQVRGKKKLAKATSIAVRLREDIPGFGRKGTVVPLPIGMMRNVYYPQSKADYVAAEDLKRLKRDGVAIERDFAFGRSMQPGETSGATDETATPRVDLKMLSPRDAFRLLDEVVPPTLDFYRTPIAAVETRREPEAKRTSQEEALQAAPPPKMTPRQSPDNIYGSVSADDVDLAIKALLQNQGMGGLVTLPEEDIRFVHIAGTETEAPRIKKLGEYEYEIRIRGHEDVIRRAVRVLPDDIEEANREIPEHGPSVAIGGPDDVERVQQPA